MVYRGRTHWICRKIGVLMYLQAKHSFIQSWFGTAAIHLKCQQLHFLRANHRRFCWQKFQCTSFTFCAIYLWLFVFYFVRFVLRYMWNITLWNLYFYSIERNFARRAHKKSIENTGPPNGIWLRNGDKTPSELRVPPSYSKQCAVITLMITVNQWEQRDRIAVVQRFFYGRPVRVDSRRTCSG